MSEQAHGCPICAYRGDGERALYAHLLTSRRKRATTDVLLERRAADAPREERDTEAACTAVR